MQLFDSVTGELSNHLPYDGKVEYHGPILSSAEADRYFDVLSNEIEWKHDVAVLFGKRHVTKRKVAWYGTKAFSYTYSNHTKFALPFTPTLHRLKSIVEEKSQETFNACLLNLYHDGSEGMSWHSDGEKDLKHNGAIASLSLGAPRKFAFKHKRTKETVPLILQHGSLLMMLENTQTNWLHRLPPTKKVKLPRINLTFRTIEKTD
jgi:alkylated DNA repair dioxygenase AlkB